MMTFLLVVGALLVAVGVVVTIVDRMRRREAEAMHLQAALSHALARHRRLSAFPLGVTARTAVGRRSPPVIEVWGEVPTAELRETTLRIVANEAIRVCPRFRLERRIAVVPEADTRVA